MGKSPTGVPGNAFRKSSWFVVRELTVRSLPPSDLLLVKLTVPLKTSLGKKKKLMQQSIDAYTRAIKYQVAEVTTEATYQIAEIYHDFARSLMGSERPKGLDEDQLEEYELLLEEQAFPFEEKAIDIHLANFKRIPAGTYDEPTRKSLQVLSELMPFRYARAESSDSHVEIQ